MNKYLQGVINGVESEGPHSTDGTREAPPQTNVVRLEDWIGPYDELVPFGRRRPPREPHQPFDDSTPDGTFAISDPPPSAEDFWGERAGAIHDALQAPSEDWAAPTDGSGRKTEIRPDERSPRRRRRLVAGRRVGHAFSPTLASPVRRRSLAAGAIVLAVVGVALAVMRFDTGPSASGGAAKTQVAFVLNDGVSRVLRLSLPVIEPRSRHRAVAVRHSVRVARRVSHPHRDVSEPVVTASSDGGGVVANSQPPATAYSAQLSPATTPPSSTSDTSRETSSSSTSSGARSTASSAAVSPTGESGALGPVHSPNG